jgi:hypothetical protein
MKNKNVYLFYLKLLGSLVQLRSMDVKLCDNVGRAVYDEFDLLSCLLTPMSGA